MILMIAMGVVLAVGVALTLWWGSAPYFVWTPPADTGAESGDPRPSLSDATRRYLRGVAVALVAGVWAGALVTGPAMRLIMRLLAATAGDAAQGRLTEAREVVGKIDLEGTLGLYIFGGILPGLLSGFVYVTFRRWLPPGRLSGLVFGLMHLVVVATRIDPLRPDNIDFAVVGPRWLAVLTFGLATIVHGMAVAAIASRFSASFPGGLAKTRSVGTRLATAAALSVPILFLIPGAVLLIPIGAGLVFAVGLLRLPQAAQLARSPLLLRVGRIAIVVLAAICLPWTVTDLISIAT